MSGTRDGVDWPPRGSVVDLPDAEAIQLCDGGMARPVVEDNVEKAVVDDYEVEMRAPLTTESLVPQPKRRGRPPKVNVPFE